MKCKYCDAERDTTPGGIEMWECGTHVSFCDGVTIQSGLCQKNELARYRAMFPVPPWSNDDITPEVCQRLGMKRISSAFYFPSRDCGDNIRVKFDSEHSAAKVFLTVNGRQNKEECIKTAGRLACLVSARRAST